MSPLLLAILEPPVNAGEFVDDFKKGAGYGSGAVVGFALPGLLLSSAAFLAMKLFGKTDSE